MTLPNIKNPINKGSTSNDTANPIPAVPYITDPTLWYQALPYRFLLTKNNGSKISVNLPISPSNLQINTRMATSLIPTLYGIIEDHSSVRFYDIVIQGTTGMAPQYSGFRTADVIDKTTVGRESFKASDNQINLQGFLPEVTNMVKQAKKIYEEVAGKQVQQKSAVSIYGTGYYAFHQLYSFFLMYKDECVNGLSQVAAPAGKQSIADKVTGAAIGAVASAAGKSKNKTEAPSPVRKEHPLTFFNYKDNQKYSVVPMGFTLTRNAENPMLYNYSIKLVAFNLQSANSSGAEELKGFNDAFKAQMGLNGLEGSLFTKTANKASTISTALSRIGITR